MYKTWYAKGSRRSPMLLKVDITTNLKIESLCDLHKLKPFLEDTTLKINESQIARELDVDRRTVKKYIQGFSKSTSRTSRNCITPYIEIIEELLSDTNQQVFYYRRVLWQYLVDNHGYKGPYGNFCRHLKKHSEFNAYFATKDGPTHPTLTVRYETPKAKQAQIDWKEHIEFVLITGEVIIINIFVFLLSYSKFRVYNLSLTKTQDILFSFLDQAFDTIEGVPYEIVTDNMKTVMDTARTKYYPGKVNIRFQQFADDYGFKVLPCIAGRPQTKAKVEAPMKILDEVRAYNGKLTYNELNELIIRINNRVNTTINQATGKIPVLHKQQESPYFKSLPTASIRKAYQLPTHTVKVNSSSLFCYKGHHYSVEPMYVGKMVQLQVYDGYIHVYYDKTCITLHEISTKKLNYHLQHYEAIALKSNVFNDQRINSIATENLRILGELYHYE